MRSGTPVIGVLPTMKPEWLTKENGIWSQDETTIVSTISNFMKNWLEDSLPEELYKSMESSYKPYSVEKEMDSVLSYFEALVMEKVTEFEASINKLKPVEGKYIIMNSKNITVILPVHDVSGDFETWFKKSCY